MWRPWRCTVFNKRSDQRLIKWKQNIRRLVGNGSFCHTQHSISFTVCRLTVAGWLQIVCDYDTQIFLFFATWQDVAVQFIQKQLITATDVQNFTLGCIEIHLPSLGPVCQWREVMLKTQAISCGNQLKNLRVVCKFQNISPKTSINIINENKK